MNPLILHIKSFNVLYTISISNGKYNVLKYADYDLNCLMQTFFVDNCKIAEPTAPYVRRRHQTPTKQIRLFNGIYFVCA